MKYFKISFFLFFIFSCKNEKKIITKAEEANLFYQCFEKYQDLLIIDIYSPPVASRMMAYPILAAFEASKSKSKYISISAQLKGFDDVPRPKNNINPSLSLVVAFCETGANLIFSGKKMLKFQDETILKYKESFDEELVNNSISYGKLVAEKILKRAKNDNYKITRGLERFEVKIEPGLWVPTPPDYADAAEPHWSKIKPLLLDTASQFSEKLNIQYSETKGSEFYNELESVVKTSKSLTNDEEEQIVFWDDNPFVSKQKGHLMFQDKKMTPGGHWLSIAKMICKNNNSDIVTATRIMSFVSIGLFDSFINCWHTKYYTNRVRPETAVNKLIAPSWHPYLVTPPFPAFTSGHSTVSASAAAILTQLIGENYAYTDSTEKPYNLTVRNFKSFDSAALEASHSRVLAGIHYQSDCEQGNKMGKNIGKFVLSRLK